MVVESRLGAFERPSAEAFAAEGRALIDGPLEGPSFGRYVRCEVICDPRGQVHAAFTPLRLFPPSSVSDRPDQVEKTYQQDGEHE